MEQDLNTILQEQLRGIYSPEAVSWWPPAPGWWILLILILLLVSYGGWLFIRHQRNNRYRKQAITALQTILNQWQADLDNSHYVQSANAVIKRAIIAANGDTYTASLSGQQWIGSLNLWAKTSLSESSTSALIEAGYKASPDVDIKMLHSELEIWLKTHKRKITSA